MGKKKVKEPDGPPKEEFDPIELVTKRPQTVVLMLQSNEELILQTVCEALYSYAEKAQENKSQLVAFGALDHLIKLLNHEDRLVRRNAVMCVGSIASEVSSRRMIRKLDGIPLLLNLLSPEEELICHEFATLGLSWLAEDFISKNEIFEKQGLPLLIQHLSSTDCDVQRNAVRTVGLLLADFQCRAVYKQSNGVEPLLVLLDSEYPVIQQLALDALIACCHENECKSSIRELNGLNKLVEILSDKTFNDLHMQCLKCLASCLDDMESLKVIQSTGLFEKLLVCIQESENSEVQQYATCVISTACQKEENRKVFFEQDTEKMLLGLLSNENNGTVTAALKGLALMAENLSSRDKIGKLDGIALIVPFLKNENTEIKEFSSLALANLTSQNLQNSQLLMDKNPLDHIIKLLSEPTSLECRINAAACLSNLASNESFRSEMLKHNVIKGLVNSLNSEDSHVRMRTCQTLAAFMCNDDARKQLAIEKGLPLLTELLQSNNESVCRNASWVITLCACDRTISQEIIESGGLSILQTISLSSRRNPICFAAMDKLLDSNLSAKYSITGVLTFDNVIDDLFYDVGKISAGSNFRSLEELYKDKLNDRRPIILVSLSKPAVSSIKEPSNKSLTTSQSSKTSTEKTDKVRSKSKNEDSKPSSRRGSRMKPQRDREEQKDKNISQEPTLEVQLENTNEAQQSLFEVPKDTVLDSLIHDVKEHVFELSSIEEQFVALATIVSDQLGGSVSKDILTSFSYELHASEVKTRLNSNVIPIGMFTKGIYYHRALLFKVLCDVLCLPCSLVRGDYGRAWNEIQLCHSVETGDIILPPVTFIVDLMHEPGTLLTPGSPDAIAYQRI